MDDDANRMPATAVTPRGRSLLKSRRAHTKTRTGCSTCKKRKVKCDEARPSCRNCTKRGVTCDFLAALRSPVLSPPTLGADPSLNLLDLELLHNFTTATYTTLSTDPAIRNLWKIGIVRLGLGCHYVMRSILSVSALHMAQHRTEKKEFYISHAIIYHQIASRTAVKLMEHLEAKDYECLWVFSILTIFFALGSPRSQNTSLLIGENAFPDWIFLYKGVRDLLHNLQSSDYTGLLSPILLLGSKRWEASHQPQHMGSNFLDELEEQIRSSVTGEELLPIYLEAIQELRGDISLVLSSDYHSSDIIDGFIWQFHVADTLMPLLRVPTLAQEAVVIFAHFCIVLHRLESHRWLQGWATWLISQAWEVLDANHRLWIQWPIEEIGWIHP